MRKNTFCLYINDKLKEELLEEANKKGLSLNAYITMLLMERNK